MKAANCQGFAEVKREDGEQCRQALLAYCYPIAPGRAISFANRIGVTHPWFHFELTGGTRAETIGFESRFRAYGPDAIEAWFEVIFWKFSSQGA